MFGDELVNLTLGNIQSFSHIVATVGAFVLLERKSAMPTVYRRVSLRHKRRAAACCKALRNAIHRKS